MNKNHVRPIFLNKTLALNISSQFCTFQTFSDNSHSIILIYCLVSKVKKILLNQCGFNCVTVWSS